MTYLRFWKSSILFGIQAKKHLCRKCLKPFVKFDPPSLHFHNSFSFVPHFIKTIFQIVYYKTVAPIIINQLLNVQANNLGDKQNKCLFARQPQSAVSQWCIPSELAGGYICSLQNIYLHCYIIGLQICAGKDYYEQYIITLHCTKYNQNF